VNEGNIREGKEDIRENVTNEHWWHGNKVFVKKKVRKRLLKFVVQVSVARSSKCGNFW